MPKLIANSLLSLLLIATMVWGGCVSCEQYFRLGGAKDCCDPDGHCKTKSGGPACTQIAFDQHRTNDHAVVLPLVAVIHAFVPVPVTEVRDWAPTLEPSPPDLQVLNSTFKI